VRCSDVTVVIIITRRHVVGTLNAKKDELQREKSKNSYTEIIRRPCTSTVAQFDTKHAKYMFTTLHC